MSKTFRSWDVDQDWLLPRSLHNRTAWLKPFVKTFKRYYARVSAKPDAASVLCQLDTWFEHYNRVQPHKALGYRPPREFEIRYLKQRPRTRSTLCVDRMGAQ